ncbi:MAG: phosphopantothenoylcysteine decarboxylase, partial [Microbacterium sp.]
ADLLAVNEVGWSLGFEADDNAVTLLDATGEVVATPSGTKREVSDALWDAILGSRGQKVTKR